MHAAVVMSLVSALWVGSAACASQAAPAQAPPVSCPDNVARVAGAAETDLADICKGVASALKFFSAHGLQPSDAIAIEVTPKLPEEAGPTASGCFIEQRRRVYIVPYNVFLRNKTWFGVPINREIYRALATHEAAHAIAGCNFRVPNATIQAKEYLAYVAMFSSMTPDLRSRALKGARTEGFDNLDRFTPILYMFDPMRFGGEAYRHYSTLTDPTGLVQSILAGRALAD
jgi:hypothetical protein